MAHRERPPCPTGASNATTNTSTSATVISSCTLTSPSTLNFGTQGVLTANVDAQPATPISVRCTNTTPYNIGLNAGTGAGATVAVRKMTSGANTINYSLYTNAAWTTVWGDTIGTNTVAATGTGLAQTYNVFGRVPPQTTPHRAPTATRSSSP